MSIVCNKCGKENSDTDNNCIVCDFSLKEKIYLGPLPDGFILNERYKILNKLKSGGMGSVYKVFDSNLNINCAVKELIFSYKSEKKLQKAEDWFKREARLLASLSHPNLPRVTDYFVSSNRYYLVMTFIEGEDLDTILEKEGKPGLPEDKIISWSKQILMVLDYLHNQEPPVIYRDMKPSNIMITKDNKAILIDFGIARTLERDDTKTAIGTLGYIPLEQTKGHPEIRSDIYSLGATMHHLITGVKPKLYKFEFEPPGKLISHLSPVMDRVIMKAVQAKAERRFTSAKEMLSALEGKETDMIKYSLFNSGYHRNIVVFILLFIFFYRFILFIV